MEQTLATLTKGGSQIAVAVHLLFDTQTIDGQMSVALLVGNPAQAFALMLTRYLSTSEKLSPFLCPAIPAASNDFTSGPDVDTIYRNRDCLVLLNVTDWRGGCSMVKYELETLGLLPFARIAYFDPYEGAWRAHYGAPALEPRQVLDRMRGLSA